MSNVTKNLSWIFYVRGRRSGGGGGGGGLNVFFVCVELGDWASEKLSGVGVGVNFLTFLKTFTDSEKKKKFKKKLYKQNSRELEPSISSPSRRFTDTRIGECF